MTITAPSFVFPLLALLALGASESRAAAASAPAAASRQAGPVVTWNPLARPEREADTVFLPDLTSLETIDRSGGFLWGHHNETSAQVKEKFAFGPGRFGPAVRPKPGDDWTFVAFPQDGLIPRDEFTMEFWSKPENGWPLKPPRSFFVVQGQRNRLGVRADERGIEAHFGTLGYWKTQHRTYAEAGLTGSDWHAFAFTLKDGTFRFYVDGKQAACFEKIPPLPPWSDESWGIILGGEPAEAANVWISDLRISRTARVPGQAVKLKSLSGTVAVDAKTAAGRTPLSGALHPGGTPTQIAAGLQVIRTDKILNATPMKAGAPDAACPTPGKSGRFSYDWQVCDRVFEWMKANGVEPYVSIDATPSILGGDVKPFSGGQLKSGLSSSSGFGPKPPNNLEDWAVIVKDFVHHVLNEKKYPVPHWGVWNEPDFGAFWEAGLEKYLDLYAVTVKAVREVEPKACIGSPEVAGFTEKWIQGLIARCGREKLPLNFVSYHDYSGDLSTLDYARAKIDEWARAAGLPTPMPIVVGEFNWSAQNLYKTGTSRFNQGMWHLRAFGAAYTTAFLIRMAELPSFEMLIYSHTAYGNPREGGWASTQLLGPKGEQWAPYNALKGWKATMGAEVLSARKDLPPGVFALAARDGKTGRVGLALVNYGYAQREARAVKVSLDGLAPGAWRMTRYLVDAKHSSRWDVAEDRPEGAAENELRKVASETLQATAGAPCELDVELPPNSSTFVSLEK